MPISLTKEQDYNSKLHIFTMKKYRLHSNMYPPAPLYSQIIKCPNIMVTANHTNQKPHFHPPQFSEWQPKTKEYKHKQITFPVFS